MVKGVNRTVIEINDTGNKYFNKVIFFVSPEYSSLPHSKLENRAKEYLGTLDKRSLSVPRWRKKRVNKKKGFLLGAIGAAVITAVTLIIIL